MRRFGVVTSAMLLALAACFIKPDRPAAVDGGPGDGSAGSDGATRSCTTVEVAELASGCGSWAFPVNTLNGAVSQSGGKLVMTLFQGMFTASAGCTTTLRRITSTTVRIEGVAASYFESTSFLVVDSASNAFGVVFDLGASGAQFTARCAGVTASSLTWSPTEHVVFRIRRGASDLILIGFGTSTDTLTEISCPTTVDALESARVELAVARGSAGSGSATATFTELELCD